MGVVSLFYSFQRVSAIVTDDEFPHAVIQISPVETHVKGQLVMMNEIKPTLPQMSDMLAATKNQRERQILIGAISALKAAL